ncbi:MAG: ATP-binding protein [Candidatus Thermoplasmatota archaeon]
MIISVASGKGGTGKTTIASNLALALEDKTIQYLDCDVEEPNSNIFIKAEINNSEQVSVGVPFVHDERCDFCGKCADFCHFNALAVIPDNVLVFPELCHDCGGCKLVCPNDAIEFKQRSVGVLEYGEKDGIDFYQGMLNVGEIQAIPVIQSLKRRVDSSHDVVVLDAPPGTSCPVIETVQESDFCVLVTEATPFGLHDLQLAVELLRHMSIPFGVVINRCDTGFKDVEVYCSNQDIPILMKIPFDRQIARLYSEGIPFINELNGWKEKFQVLYQKIVERVEK